MIDDELIRIWQSSPNQERAKFEKSRLMIDVQSSVDDLHRKIKYRDLREQIPALIVIPGFAYYVFVVPPILSKFASVLVILWVGYVILRLRKTKKSKPGAYTTSYLDYLHKTREYIEAQKHLIDTVLYWYILPCWAIVTLFIMGFMGESGKLRWMIQTEILTILIGVATFFMNKRAVKKHFVPRLEKIDALINIMEKP